MAPEVEPDPNLIALGGPEGTLGMVMGAMNRGWHYGACQKKRRRKKKKKYQMVEMVDALHMRQVP